MLNSSHEIAKNKINLDKQNQREREEKRDREHQSLKYFSLTESQT